LGASGRISAVGPPLGSTLPDDLHRVDIERALTAMHDAAQSERSIHQAAVVLNTALAWACEHGVAHKNPVRSPPVADESADRRVQENRDLNQSASRRYVVA
jgi:hypothetical protein